MADETPSEVWELTNSLEGVAQAYGWHSTQKVISDEELVIRFQKDPLIALIDALPQ